MNKSNRRPLLEEVLDEFFYASEVPSPDALNRALKKYPEYKKELADFAARWAAHHHAATGTDELSTPEVNDESVSLLQSFVFGKLHTLAQEKAVVSSETDTGTAKVALDKLAGAALRNAANEAGLYGSTVLLQKILRNTITGVPQKIERSLATFLGVSIDALRSAIAKQSAEMGLSYKSLDRPIIANTETWEHAVRGLSLPEEKKKALLALTYEE